MTIIDSQFMAEMYHSLITVLTWGVILVLVAVVAFCFIAAYKQGEANYRRK